MPRPSRPAASLLALAVPLSLGPLLATPAAQAVVSARQIVVLADATDDVASVASELLGPLGLVADQIWQDALDGFTVRAPADALVDLLADPRVALVEQARSMTLAAQSLPAGIDRIDADQQVAAGIGTGTNVDVDVAVIDTGIDEHADLNLVSHFDCVSGLFSSGCNAGGGDGHGHGTHVAGTIGALDNSLDVVGVAPGARMHGYKVLNDLLGSGSSADIIDAIDHVTARGDIEVINMSLGGSGSSSATDQAIAGATAAGVVVVVAAGNDSANASGYTPANSPKAITVSAITDTDGVPGGLGGACSGADDTLATYSNFGDIIDIAAPGSCVVSLRPGGGTAQMSGTSMASPHVAGGAALWIAAHGTPASATRWSQVLTGLTTEWGAAQDGPCGYATSRNADPLLHLTGCGDAPVGNNAPTVDISSPAQGTSVDLGDAITFTATAQDLEDGDLGSAVQWTSDRDGALGAGATITSTLTEGAHVVTAAVQDTNGAQSLATVAVTIVGEAPATSSSISEVTWAQGSLLFGGRYADVTLQVVDQDRVALAATVTVEILRDGVVHATHHGTTASNGAITFENNGVTDGTYTAVVTAVSVDEHPFDGVTPPNEATVQTSRGLFG